MRIRDDIAPPKKPESPQSFSFDSSEKNIDNGETAAADYDVVCPYCQNTFNINDVRFRAEDPASSDIDPINPYVEKTHDKFINFWKEEMHWNESANMREFSDCYSWVNDNETSGTPVNRVKFCLLDDSRIKDIHRNSRGIITSVTDKRDIKTEKRVCPHCLCILPKNYGVVKTLFFSIVGIKGSGKTVYLSKFFETASEQLAPLGITVLETPTMTRFCNERKLSVGSPVPGGTPREHIYPPVFMDIINSSHEQYTCVFYDIAGENCVRTGDIEEYGKFVKNSDGMIMLISPKQIPDFEVNSEEDDASDDGTSITSVLSTIASNYATPYIENKKRCPLKLAVAISKSDLLKNMPLRRYNNITLESVSPALFKNFSYKSDNKGFMTDESDNTEGAILRILSSTPLAENIKNLYENVHYFAVSALGAKPTLTKDSVKYVPEGDCIHLSEPFGWILSEFGIIPEIR